MMNQDKPTHFDYLPVAAEAGLGDEEIALIEQSWKKEYPYDDLLRELHVLRTIIAIRDGLCSIDEAIAPRVHKR